ncbi:YveK family protein [Jeotgalibacillus proteolyticus]|uniref:Capsular biosynthesis protein n=1 Tax=Jeotgalibacillus proteolyticus TaxID=2082395 RepID=A0A2S5G8D3_9BACL|nr:Wzz/FepE/Etk N-terminal domain-containing protein [Jeotgalibacillus proteolyticus]PPA69246.1 capsular biosynthesis protein [Jeotgalibacillus proteolyticus]
MSENGLSKGFVRDINLLEYFQVIKKRLWLIMLLTVLMGAAGYYYTQSNNTSIYQSSKRIIISSDNENMKTLMVMIKDPIVMAKVIEDLGLQQTPQGLASQINVEQIDESRVVQITVTNTDPERAALIADATAANFRSEVRPIIEFENIQLLSDATVNPLPINESQNKTIIMIAGFGLILGVGISFFLESLDGTIRREKEVEELLGIPVIGAVPNLNKKKLLKQRKNNSALKLGGEVVDLKQKAANER